MSQQPNARETRLQLKLSIASMPLCRLLWLGSTACLLSSVWFQALASEMVPVNSGYEACEDPPNGMVCIPGGPAIIGSDEDSPAEKPKHRVDIPTFYIDRYEVTNEQYRACEKARFCPPRIKLPNLPRDIKEPDHPATPISWWMAHRYCVWAGKRLPSEAEWEKVARGGEQELKYPWGNQEPSCDQAVFQGCESRVVSHPVGSLPSGPFGVFDMAGNGYEWVKDWWSPCYQGCPGACGQACQGFNPQGPCGGVPRCPGFSKRILKGGGWFLSESWLRSSLRKAQAPFSGAMRLSFRCATTTPVLSTWPPLALSDPLPELSLPEPPDAESFRLFRNITEDTDVLKIPKCYRQGLAKIDCRDPKTYIRTNERSQHVWVPYIKNLGGGYVGVGADQNYSLIAVARSRWAWLFDYDPLVVRVHQIIRAVVLQSPTPEEFVEAFSPKNLPRTTQWVEDSLQEAPKEQKATTRLLSTIHEKLYKHYLRSSRPRPDRYSTAIAKQKPNELENSSPGDALADSDTGLSAPPRFISCDATCKSFGWLRNSDAYQYIRQMFQQGRILAFKGNMLTDKAMPSIASSAKNLGAIVRVYYPSNAEENWILSEQYRENILSLPFDERSVVIRTLYSRKWKNRSDGLWHYVVHSALAFQRELQANNRWRTRWFMDESLPTQLPLLSIIRLPSRALGENSSQSPEGQK